MLILERNCRLSSHVVHDDNSNSSAGVDEPLETLLPPNAALSFADLWLQESLGTAGSISSPLYGRSFFHALDAGSVAPTDNRPAKLASRRVERRVAQVMFCLFVLSLPCITWMEHREGASCRQRYSRHQGLTIDVERNQKMAFIARLYQSGRPDRVSGFPFPVD